MDCPPAPAQCAFPTGQSVLDYLNFDGGDEEIWLNVLYLVSLCLHPNWCRACTARIGRPCMHHYLGQIFAETASHLLPVLRYIAPFARAPLPMQ